VRPAAGDRLSIERFLDQAAQAQAMADEVRRGLTDDPKHLPSKYFYDERGSQLFEQITELPEYYPTRTELRILQRIADPLVAGRGYRELVEIGSGAATKTRILLDAMEKRGTLARYVPLDVSEEMLRQSSLGLLERYRQLRIHGVVGDFQRDLASIPPSIGPRLVIFLGSTIGNLEDAERVSLLRGARGLLGPGDAFLLGIDLVKDIAVIERAYNDAAGVTAAFNRNILNVINGQFDADFRPERYAHRAFYNRGEDRIEMHLVPDRPQHVTVRRLNLAVDIAAGESIRTEISCKFTRERVVEMLTAAGMHMAEWYSDPDNLFGLALATLWRNADSPFPRGQGAP
jgi:L-histidine N-alpha-methyltransferase